MVSTAGLKPVIFFIRVSISTKFNHSLSEYPFSVRDCRDTVHCACMGTPCCNSGWCFAKPCAANILKFSINNKNSHSVLWFWLCSLTLFYNSINPLTWSNSSSHSEQKAGDSNQRPINVEYLKSVTAWPAFTISLNWIAMFKFLAYGWICN